MVDLLKLFEYARNEWQHARTIVIVGTITFLSLFKFFDIDILNLNIYTTTIILLIVLLEVLFWIKTNEPPRCLKKHVGIAVAISAETKEEYQTIASDLITTLRRLLDSGETIHKFCLIEIPQHISVKILNAHDADKLRAKSQCHFMIWGTAKIRPINGKDRHVIDLEGVVCHKKLSHTISRKLSKEFSELFPRHIRVDRENDVVSLQFTSEWVDCVARYIIGIAASLSGDINYAESLYRSILTNEKLRNIQFPAIIKIQQRIPVRLEQIYHFRGRLAHYFYIKTKNTIYMDELGKYLDVLHTINPASYFGHLLRSIYYFEKRDINSAQSEIKKCQNNPDNAWRFSAAFLSAYRGHMCSANHHYKKAFAKPSVVGFINEIDAFIERIVVEEPLKVQLHYCLGLIRLKGKNDLRNAMNSFKTFLVHEDSMMFKEERKISEKYLKFIESQIHK